MSKFIEYVKERSKLKHVSMREWLIDAAEKANLCTRCTHTVKYSDPNADKDISIYTEEKIRDHNGYLYTATVFCRSDYVGTAAVIPIGKLLLRTMNDGKTVLEHLQLDSQEIRDEIETVLSEESKTPPDNSIDYRFIRNGLLKALPKETPQKSDKMLRQVFFPVGDGEYHTLSLLTSSAVLMEVKDRISGLREAKKAVNEVIKEAEKKKEKIDPIHYQMIKDMTVMGIGGGNPANISCLTSINAGKALLFRSVPPTLSGRRQKYPEENFFTEFLPSSKFYKLFLNLYKRLSSQKQNQNARLKLYQAEKNIIDTVLSAASFLQCAPAGWSNDSPKLPDSQKIWLDPQYKEKRRNEKEWKLDISNAIAEWMILTFAKTIKREKLPPYNFGDYGGKSAKKDAYVAEIFKALL